MKKVVLILGLVLMSCMALASEPDMDLDFIAVSGRDMDADFYLEAGRDLDLNINGEGFDGMIANRISSSHRSMDSIYSLQSGVLVEKDPFTNRWYFKSYKELTPLEAQWRWAIEVYTLNNVVDYYESRIEELEITEKILIKYIGEDLFCSLKLEVGKEEGIEEITCKNKTYSLMNGEYIILTTIIDNPVVDEPKSQPERLCEQGMNFLCQNYTYVPYEELICSSGKILKNGICTEEK